MQLFLHRSALIALLTVIALAAFPTAVSAETPELVAESAIVIDGYSGEVLYEKNSTEPRAMASLTKLFTALVALETVSLDTQMVVEPIDLVGEASMGLSAGDVVTLETLLHGLVLPSGNDAASTIARVVGRGSQEAFVQRANARIAELGLTQTHLVNPHGLDAEGHYSTARDIAAVTMYALQHQPELVDAIHTASYSGDGYTLYNTNRLLSVYPGLIGGKTGLTDDAGYCLMQVAEIDGRQVLVVLLGSTWASWYADAERLLDYGFDVLATPGRVSSGNTITFPVEAERVVANAFHVADTGLMVSQQPGGSEIVASPALLSTRGWSPWFWFGAVAVTAPSVLFIALQLQKLFALMAYGPPQRRTAVGAHARGQGTIGVDSLSETMPFPLITGASMPIPAAYEPTWSALSSVGAARDRRNRVRSAAPSFVGD